MKKRWISLLLMAVLIFVSACSNDNQNVHQDDKYGKDGKIKIIEYGDFKCPYCKKVEENIMPKLKKEYIDTKKVDYQFVRSEEHTSELQSRFDLVCRLLLEKKNLDVK